MEPLPVPPAMPPAEAFAPLLTESLNGFAVLDSSGRYVYVSESLCDLLSLSKDALLGCVGDRQRAQRAQAARRAAMRFCLWQLGARRAPAALCSHASVLAAAAPSRSW
jgi:PAS domain-containing protein